MSETEVQQAREGAFERGRYALFGESLMSLVIARTTDLCDTCQACTCGTRMEPIKLADVIREAMMAGPREIKRRMKEAMASDGS